MAEKVKVSRELGLALDGLLKGEVLTEERKSQLIHKRVHKQFSETSLAWGIHKNLLNKIGTMKFARILDNGYEYEQTPEEQLINWFKSSKEQFDKLEGMSVERWDKESREEHYTEHHYYRMEVETLGTVLNILNIKINGVNDY